MILSNLEIQKAIDDGRLIIQPEPLPRNITPDMPSNSCPYNTTSVDLRLHSEIAVPKPGKYANDMTQPGAISEQITKNSTPYTLSTEQPYRLEQNKFIIAWTYETIELCTNIGLPYLSARIDCRRDSHLFLQTQSTFSTAPYLPIFSLSVSNTQNSKSCL